MMNHTDRFFRYLARRLSKRVRLYTEMVSAAALLRGPTEALLRFDPSEHPVALQIGGSDPKELAACARRAEAAGYDEINLNVGCPSGRVHAGGFGACLFTTPGRVADAVAQMCAAVGIPVTVKTRIGVDDQDTYEHLARFIQIAATAGCTTFVIHARKAWLSGLDPRANRTIPPLDYATVYRIKRDFPHLNIVINGGIKTVTETELHLRQCDGVMVGRAIYQDPYWLADADRRLFGDTVTPPTRVDVIESMYPFIATELAAGTPLHRITRHLLNLYHGQAHATLWRRYLTEHGHYADAGIQVLRDGVTLMREWQCSHAG